VSGMPKLNIHSRSCNPHARELSNLAAHTFVMDGVKCSSMEGFLQSLKYPYPEMQEEICGMVGLQAKQYRSRHYGRSEWQHRGILHWQGKRFTREGDEYAGLLTRAFQALYDQSEGFRVALAGTAGMWLTHTFGHHDPFKTVLTQEEFCKLLTSLREEQKARL